MKVLVADQFEQSGLDGLAASGCEVVFDPGLKDETLAAALAESGADVLIVRSTKVSAAMMAAGSLALIVRAGAGYNTIDVPAASARGIYVSNCPGKNAIAVAELAFGLILSLDRRIPDNVAELRAGHWDKKRFSKARGIQGATLGLLGFGNIAQELARRAQAFGMEIVIWARRFEADPEIDPAAFGLDSSAHAPRVSVAPTPAEVADRADVLSVHVALAAETRGLVNAELLGHLRPGAFFINTSRAEVVDHGALASAVRDNGLRVGLDVFPDEPTTPTADFRLPILELPGVYGTHHIGASTEQAQEAIAAETVRIVRSFKETGRVPNVVNLARRTRASSMLVVRHLNRPGVLAHVFEQLLVERINVLETENIIFEDGEAAVARINLDGAPSNGLLAAIEAADANIISLQLVAL
ncbi:MAG TPA: NAD(P)-dependent oxidoreductase [Candidatus Limnocylindrales bacterium]|jgi:D-3-phosphoglycerate dehydrogenase